MITYRLSGVVLDLDLVRAVAAQKVLDRTDPESGASLGTLVSAEVIASTARQYPECRCNELGLEAGFPVGELYTLEEGCTVKVMQPPRIGVCNRLNTIRGIYRPWASPATMAPPLPIQYEHLRERDNAANADTINEHFDKEPADE